MRAIPKQLLIHSVGFHKKADEDRWGNGTEKHEIEVSCVRIEPSSKIIRSVNNSEIQLSATLIFDCRNSSPKNLEFEHDDIITFNGQKHQIKLVEPLYDNKKLHHIEIGLVRKA